MTAPAGVFVHYSQARQDWETPAELFDPLDAEFRFELDACATWENRKCDFYFSAFDDGLSRSWQKRVVWCNPPYGREIGKWVAKARHEAARGATVVCLVPARTDTAWWHENVAGHAEVRFIRGRVPFVRTDGQRSRAPFPSAVLIFRPEGRL